jgi:hypothetical protein
MFTANRLNSIFNPKKPSKQISEKRHSVTSIQAQFCLN